MTRLKIAALSLSASALVGIASWEGYRSNAYIPIPGDVPTIGFGTTKGVKMGDTIDPVKALQRKLSDVKQFEGALKQCVTVPLHQHEYDSYLSLAYNIGPTAFCKSTLVRLLNQGQYQEACQQILRWDRAGGRVVAGLTNRRQEEYRLCIGELR
jgi:lysozyme